MYSESVCKSSWKETEMFWVDSDEEEEALLCSPALMARRASESWIVAPPVEVCGVNSRSDNNYELGNAWKYTKGGL